MRGSRIILPCQHARLNVTDKEKTVQTISIAYLSTTNPNHRLPPPQLSDPQNSPRFVFYFNNFILHLLSLSSVILSFLFVSPLTTNRRRRPCSPHPSTHTDPLLDTYLDTCVSLPPLPAGCALRCRASDPNKLNFSQTVRSGTEKLYSKRQDSSSSSTRSGLPFLRVDSLRQVHRFTRCRSIGDEFTLGMMKMTPNDDIDGPSLHTPPTTLSRPYTLEVGASLPVSMKQSRVTRRQF